MIMVGLLDTNLLLEITLALDGWQNQSLIGNGYMITLLHFARNTLTVTVKRIKANQ